MTSDNHHKDYGMLRVAAAVPQLSVGDVEFNTHAIIQEINRAAEAAVQVLVFPELALTGYTCADLLGNDLLLDKVEHAIEIICELTIPRQMMIAVGAPLRKGDMLFNCAVIICGCDRYVVPKTYLPNYKEFYEKRWFTSGRHPLAEGTIKAGKHEIPFGRNVLFKVNKAIIGVEVCEDLWVPLPPSTRAALNGANVLLNLSASNELVGKHDYLTQLIRHQSNHCIAAYVYASSGWGESTTDLVFSGTAMIAENGNILAQAERFSTEPQLLIADIDVDALNNERRLNSSFSDCSAANPGKFNLIELTVSPLQLSPDTLLRNIRPLPFVPDNEDRLGQRCEEIVNIQTTGLMRRLNATGIRTVVVGISGGLDSTLALMIAVRAFDRLGYDRKGIIGITMPGFGTTSRTLNNALQLMNVLGITTREISIAKAVEQHLNDIDHPLDAQDTTYENAQARERTQILMDYANKTGGLVLGTGDLSESALGWCTYNGDHMSMYNVNCSVPKTLAKSLIEWFAVHCNPENPTNLTIHETLLDVLHTPISPELTPADNQGQIKQKTEDIIGPYILHDFFLYHMLRYGFSPRKIHFLARNAFRNTYDSKTIKHWLTVFCKRFFQQQFKRSCVPDGPKVGSVSLSPRGDWRMPSDASAALWMKQCAELDEDNE